MGMMLLRYQVDGALFLAHRRRALLADDMGLGKTPQAVAASEMIGARNITVICPAIVCQTWMAEFQRWRIGASVPVNIVKHGGDTVRPDGAVIVSYDLALQPKIRAALMTRPRRELLILDEAHYLKNYESQRTRAILGPASDGVDGVAGVYERTWLLTATPAPNDCSELFPALRFCGQWQQGYGRFLSEHAVWQHNRFNKISVTGTKNPDGLRHLLGPVMLRRLKSDVARDLPPITIGDVLLEPGDNCAELLTELRELQPRIAGRIEAALDDEDWSFGDDPAVARVRQLIGLVKVGSVVKLLQHEEHNKIVVFGLHRLVLQHLAGALPASGLIDGSTPATKRQKLIESFQAAASPRHLILQTKTGGTGLTLTAASNVLVAESAWTPADNAQAIMRVHRIGQTQPVLARFATLVGTIDEAVNSVLRKKAQQISAFLA